MTIKIGTMLEESLLRQAKEAARQQHRPLHHVFEQALEEYLARHGSHQSGPSAIQASFGALRLPKKLARRLAEEEIDEIG